MARPELIQEAYKIYANRRQPKPSQQVDTQPEDKRSFREKLAERALKLIDNAAFQVNQVLHEDLDEQAAEFTRAHPNQWVSIECLGVWDTVPALGLVPAAALNFLIDRVPSWKHQYHDFKLHPSVRNAYQALSIDDDRKWFFPSLWKEYDPNKQKMEQVWFGGAHTDVGGGFWEAGFSDLALEWMVQKTAQHGLRLFFGSRRYWNFTVAPDYTDVIHPPRVGIGRIYKRGIREAVWDREAYKLFGPPKIHESVLERAKHDRSYRPWILINYPRTVDEWFRKKYEDEMLDRYIKEMQLEYESWYMKMREDGRTNLPGPAKWIADLPVSHEKWLAKNDYSFEAWLAQNEFFFDELKGDEFKGKKILVERTKPKLPLDFELRDYDRDSLPVRLAKTYEDRFAFDNLLERSMSRKFNRDRIKYDSDRWKPRDSPKDPEG